MWRRRRQTWTCLCRRVSVIRLTITRGRGIRLPSFREIYCFWLKTWRLEFSLASFAFWGRSCVAGRLKTTVKVASLNPIDSESREVALLPERVGKRTAALQKVAFRLPRLDLNENQGHLLCCSKSHENYGFRRCTFRFQGHPSIPSHFCTLQAHRFFLFIFFMLQHLKCKVNA